MSTSDESSKDESLGPKRPRLITGAVPQKTGAQFVSPSTSATKPVTTPVVSTTPTPVVANPTKDQVAPEPENVESEAQAETVARPPKKKGMSMAVKGMIGTLLGLTIVILGWVLMDRMAANKRNQEIQALFQEAAKTGATSVEMNEDQFSWILDYVSSVSFDRKKAAAYQTLALARGPGSEDYDRRLAEFATSRELIEEVRVQLFRAIGMRKGESAAPFLIKFARESSEQRAATAALDALRGMITERELPAILEILATNESDEVRGGAERVVRVYGEGKRGTRSLARALAKQYEEATDVNAQEAFLRLLGSTGHDSAAPVLKKAFATGRENLQAAVIAAFENWRDDSQFPLHLSLSQELESPFLREQSFESLVNFLAGDSKKKPGKERGYWEAVIAKAESQKEKFALISGLVRIRKDWSAELIQPFGEDSDKRVRGLAEKALRSLSEKEKAS